MSHHLGCQPLWGEQLRQTSAESITGIVRVEIPPIIRALRQVFVSFRFVLLEGFNDLFGKQVFAEGFMEKFTTQFQLSALEIITDHQLRQIIVCRRRLAFPL